ncbi:hypothetical protein D1872_248370 [compost metagenome]
MAGRVSIAGIQGGRQRRKIALQQLVVALGLNLDPAQHMIKPRYQPRKLVGEQVACPRPDLPDLDLGHLFVKMLDRQHDFPGQQPGADKGEAETDR